MGIKVPYSTNFKDLQKVYDSLVGKVHRKITKINYDNETKKMMIDYDDGTSKVFNEVEVADVCEQHRLDSNVAEIVYNFKDFFDDLGKYVEDFGDDNE